MKWMYTNGPPTTSTSTTTTPPMTQRSHERGFGAGDAMRALVSGRKRETGVGCGAVSGPRLYVSWERAEARLRVIDERRADRARPPGSAGRERSGTGVAVRARFGAAAAAGAARSRRAPVEGRPDRADPRQDDRAGHPGRGRADGRARARRAPRRGFDRRRIRARRAPAHGGSARRRGAGRGVAGGRGRGTRRRAGRLGAARLRRVLDGRTARPVDRRGPARRAVGGVRARRHVGRAPTRTRRATSVCATARAGWANARC